MKKNKMILLVLAVVVVVVLIIGIRVLTQPPLEDPVAQDPAVEEPVAEEPVAEEPVIVDVEPNLANDPMQDRVDAGELPPLIERLPDNPQVVPVRDGIGTYGGEVVTWYEGAGAGHLRMWLYDPLIRWAADYSGYEPNLVETWEWSADGRTITYTLLAGVRWSDGHPFTTEDIRYWWEDLVTFEDSGYLPPWWSFNEDGTTMQVNILNETQFQFVFNEPNWVQPYIMAQGFWEWGSMKKPMHYLSQFHPKHNPEHTDFIMHLEMDNYIINPDFPTLNAWVTVTYDPGVRIVLERNPFYWKIDTEGNQLPYIDRIVALRVDDAEVRLLRTLGGEFDLSIRGIDPRNIPTLIRNEERGNYDVLLWTDAAGGWPGMLVNQDHVGDEYMRTLLRNPLFRQAVSVAIDRVNINEAIWRGMGTVQQGTISAESPHFAMPGGQELFERWQQSWAQHDLDLANQKLDEIGLTQRNPRGFRLRTDGRPLVIYLDVTAWGMRDVNVAAAQLMKVDLALAGIDVEIRDVPDPEAAVRFDSAEWMFSFAHAAELDLWTYPDWVFPVQGNRAWPLQGRWHGTGGLEGEQPYVGSSAQILYDLFLKGRAMNNVEDRHAVVHEAVEFLIEEGPFYIGITGGIPQPVVARPNLRNVPQTGVLGPWAPGSPGNLNINTIFWEE